MAVAGPFGLHGLEFEQKLQFLGNIFEFSNFFGLFFLKQI